MPRRPQRLHRPSCVLILGAGWSAATGLPLASQLFERAPGLDGPDRDVIDAYEQWQHEHPKRSAEQFIAYAYEGRAEHVLKSLPGSPIFYLDDPQLALDLTGGRTIRRDGVGWSEVAAYLQRRLTAPTLQPRTHSQVRYRPALLRRTPSAEQARFWNALLEEILVRAIVTTNYDVTIEQTVGITPNAIPGSPGFHYAGIDNTVHPVSSGFGRDHINDPSPIGVIPLAKLHGSLNWSLTEHGVQVYPDLRPAFRRGGDAAIVPPLPEKYVPEWLEPVWDRAHAELNAADEWVVVGYSLPPYDYQIHTLLAMSARNVRRIRIYDPFANDIAPRWHETAPNACIDTFPGLTPNVPASTIGRLPPSELYHRRHRALSDPRLDKTTNPARRSKDHLTAASA